MDVNIFLFLGALNGFLSVALGAFGAHALEGILTPERMSTWETAVRYEMYHAFALVAVGLLKMKFPTSKLLNWAGWLFFLGIVLFTGSLFIICLAGITTLGIITPMGGVSFLIGWLLLMIAAKKLFA